MLELWQFAADRLEKSNSRYRPYIMSWRQLCQLFIDLMVDYRMGPCDNNEDSSILDDDSLRYAAEWLSGLMVSLNQTKVTLFDLRAFFELDLWRNGRTLICTNGNITSPLDRRNSLRNLQTDITHQLPSSGSHSQNLSLKRMFQIALDLDKLMRKTKKISLNMLEQILFDRFNVSCLWIPQDVTLTIVSLLYENHTQERQTKLTTNEVKKLDRFREIGKMATNWIMWLLQDGRFEVCCLDLVLS